MPLFCTREAYEGIELPREDKRGGGSLGFTLHVGRPPARVHMAGSLYHAVPKNYLLSKPRKECVVLPHYSKDFPRYKGFMQLIVNINT